VTGRIEFGKEGKPLFINGPHDNVQAILRQLMRTAGEGNFDYIAHLGPPAVELLSDDFEEYQE